MQFTRRFDANSLLYISNTIDYFDFRDELHKASAKFLVMGITSDWLYSVQENKEIVKILNRNFLDAEYQEIDSRCGHDAFLVEFSKFAPKIKEFLSEDQQLIGIDGQNLQSSFSLSTKLRSVETFLYSITFFLQINISS